MFDLTISLQSRILNSSTSLVTQFNPSVNYFEHLRANCISILLWSALAAIPQLLGLYAMAVFQHIFGASILQSSPALLLIKADNYYRVSSLMGPVSYSRMCLSWKKPFKIKYYPYDVFHHKLSRQISQSLSLKLHWVRNRIQCLKLWIIRPSWLKARN